MQLTTINNRYEVVRELGHGGMGNVQLVKDLHRDGSHLALKTIRPNAMSDDSLERFRVEFQGLARLSHPNIATAYDFGRISGTDEHFFTTSFVEGVDVFVGTSKASLTQLLDVFAQTLRGIEFVHAHGLLHNDLKPLNILLERPPAADGRDGESRQDGPVGGAAGKVKIIDFGLLSAEHVAFDRIIGTPLFLSPERICGRAADRRADLYSLGLVFYLLCARVPPFREKDTNSLLRAQLEAEPPSLTSFRGDLPPAVIELIRRMTRKRPADRIESASAALAFLGKELPQEVSTGAGLSTPELSSGKLLHRGAELLFLENCFKSVAARSMGDCCAAVLGPAGVGKTRLVRELRSLVQVSGGAYIEVGGSAVEGHLLPILDVVLRGLETSGMPGAAALRERVASPREAVGLSAQIEQILLEGAARVPILLFFDDFQNASETVRRFALELVETTTELLQHGSDLPRLLVVIASQADGARSACRSGTPTVTLTPFDDRASADFLEAIFTQDDIPGEVVAGLSRIACGNPGLLIELSRELADKRCVEHNGSRWVFPSSIAGLPLLDSLPACLEEKIAALDAESRGLCEVLSVSASPLSSRFLAACCMTSDSDVKLRLDRLTAKGLVVSGEHAAEGKPPAGDAAASVRLHSLSCAGARRSITSALTHERRVFLHRRIAQTLEEERGGASPEAAAAEAMAHHWLEAENGPAFLRYAQAAAQSLHRCGSLALAADYQLRIVEAMPPDAIARKLQALARLSEAHELLWDLERSKKDAERILSLGKALLKPADRAGLWRRIAALEMAMSRNSEALAAIEQARKALDNTPEPLVGLALDAAEAWAAWCAGESERSGAALARAGKVLAVRGDADPRQKALIAGALNHLGNLHQVHGRLTRAAETFKDQLGVVAALSSPQAEAATRCSYGGVLLDLGAAAEALEELTRALSLARGAGDLRTLCRARDRLAEHHLRYGDVKAALVLTEAALEDAESCRNAVATANSLRTLGRIHLQAGRTRDAAVMLNRALELHTRANDRAGTPLSRLALARLAVVEGRYDEALHLAAAAGDEAVRGGIPLGQALAELVRAETALLRRGELPTGAAEAAEQALRSCGYLAELHECRLLVARAAMAADNVAAAIEILTPLEAHLAVAGTRQARAEAELLRARVEIAQGRRSAAVKRLRHLRHLARNCVLPALERECDKALADLSAESAAVESSSY